MRTDWSVYRGMNRPLKLLVITQFAFNVGFYLVVPFLASYLEEDLRLGGALIGLILGLRTFSQQGLFFIGGALADRFGVKPVVLTGIALRIAGFLVLALTRDLGAIVGGVVLIGVAAALFSPASESAITGLAGSLERAGGPRRTQVLSLQNVASQAGSAVGPVLGGVVLFVPFQATCLIAAGLFALIGLVHLGWLPRGLRAGDRVSVATSLRVVLCNRHFLAFAALNCIMLVAYNQMYLALPVEISRAGAESGTLTWYFLVASLVVIVGQAQVTRYTDKLSLVRVYQLGYVVTAVAFGVVGAVAWFPAPDGWRGVLPTVVFVVLLHLGMMIIKPRSRDAAAVLAGEQNLGATMGVMASVGGLAVLLSGGPLGALLEGARTPGAAAVIAWLVVSALALSAALVSGPLLRRVSAGTRSGKEATRSGG